MTDFELLSAGARAANRTPALPLDVRWVPSVTSTMDVAAELVHAGAPEGVVICADEQTAGRGRRGRVWSSPAGAGLYFSLVLRPSSDLPGEHRVLALITLSAGVAVREAIGRATGLVASLKWPNDVLVKRRKLAGILAEGLSIGSRDQTVVLGIGLNVRTSAFDPDLAARATALEAELGRAVDRALVFEEVLVSLAAYYDRLKRGGADDILRAWRAASPSAVGTRVELPDGRAGVTAGVDGHGALRVETASGMERVIAGELRWP